MSWERSVSGPGWWDIAQIIAEIEKTHQCIVYLMVLHDGQRGAPALRILCTATREAQINPSMEGSVGTDGRFPCADHKTMEGAVWECLFQLEMACTRAWWDQMSLWEANTKRAAPPA